jgi:hypothetical protein
MPIIRLIAVACALAGFAGGARAQQSPLSYDALARAKNGSWATYTVNIKGQPKPFTVKYAVVEKGDKKVALEIESDTPLGLNLVHMAFAVDHDTYKMTSGRMQAGSAPAQDLPAEMQKAADIKKGETPGKLIGSEKVTTPAGSFDCKHYQKVLPPEAGGSTFEMWMSDKVTPTGLVKMTEAAHGFQFLLSGVGSGATAKLK